MEKQTVRRYKWFWPWQDEEQERWLSQQSLDGWHLTSVGGIGFAFECGEPRDYVYQLDHWNQNNRALAEYLDFFRAAGWEHLGSVSGWQYFRRPKQAGGADEIYTDAESKVLKYQRLQRSLMWPSPAMMIIVLAMFKRFPGRHPPWFVALTIALFVAWNAFAAVTLIMVLRRIDELKRIRRI